MLWHRLRTAEVILSAGSSRRSAGGTSPRRSRTRTPDLRWVTVTWARWAGESARLSTHRPGWPSSPQYADTFRASRRPNLSHPHRPSVVGTDNNRVTRVIMVDASKTVPVLLMSRQGTCKACMVVDQRYQRVPSRRNVDIGRRAVVGNACIDNKV